MSIFGDLDIDQISDDPFGVADGTYLAFVSKAEYREGKDREGNELGYEKLWITWTIDEPDNQYNKLPVRHWFPHFPPGTKLNEIDPQLLKQLKFLKKYCREGFDLSETEMKEFNPSDLIGKEAYITVKVNGEFTNINGVKSQRFLDETGGAVDQNISEVSSGLGI